MFFHIITLFKVRKERKELMINGPQGGGYCKVVSVILSIFCFIKSLRYISSNEFISVIQSIPDGAF